MEFMTCLERHDISEEKCHSQKTALDLCAQRIDPRMAKDRDQMKKSLIFQLLKLSRKEEGRNLID